MWMYVYDDSVIVDTDMYIQSQPVNFTFGPPSTWRIYSYDKLMLFRIMFFVNG
jgi:hypothetical protein